jgi:hypothetical protein
MRLSFRRLHHKRLALSVSALVISTTILHFFLIDLRTIDFDLFYPPSVPVSDDPPGAWSEHPVVLLHKRAQADFEALIRRQSRTADAAETEYKRRYGTEPPPGFRQWVAYALKLGSPIIDDFDTIGDGVHRYSHLTAAEIGRRMRGAAGNGDGLVKNNGVERCVFAERKFSKGCRQFAQPLTELLGAARLMAPNTEFLLNFLDEPSVLPIESVAGDLPMPLWEDLSHQPLAGAVAGACRLRGNSTSSTVMAGILEAGTYRLPFVGNVAAAKDLCKHSEYGSLHGFLMCPPTMRRMKRDIPILSQAAPYPFADILYPSTHYGLKSSLYRQSQDRAWARKKNSVYWTGSSTGGHWSRDTWRNGHRQRLAMIGMHKQERNFTYLRSSSGKSVGVEPYVSRALCDSLFDVALTKVVGCADDSVCDAMNSFFDTPREADPESKAFRYRFLLDIDGNSYSGRFYRFLASRSVPLKISIFREWHDERLIPWLHYVPVSQSMEELPELIRFLATTAEGQEISHRIAEAGREWYFRALTPPHQGIYLYRLMLELAWLHNSSRTT